MKGLEHTLKNIKDYFLLSFVIFFLSLACGILFVEIYPDLAKEAFEELTDAFAPILELQPLTMGLFIFLNNSLKIFLFILLGVLVAIPTLFFLVVNGWVLGYVIGLHYPELGAEGIFHLFFYHGIFEITALLLGSSLGIYLGVLSLKEIKNKASKKELGALLSSSVIKKALFSSLRVFIYIIIPLLFVAAIIETFLIFYL